MIGHFLLLIISFSYSISFESLYSYQLPTAQELGTYLPTLGKLTTQQTESIAAQGASVLHIDIPCSCNVTIIQKGASKDIEATFQATYPKDTDKPKIVLERKQERIVLSIAYAQPKTTSSLTLIVPADMPIQGSLKQGASVIKGIPPYLNWHQQRGSITLFNQENDSKKTSALSSMSIHMQKGSITLHTPENTQAHLHAVAPSGTINSQLMIHLDPLGGKINKQWWKEQQHHISGRLGTAIKTRAHITLETFNGSINIIKAEGDSAAKKAPISKIVKA